MNYFFKISVFLFLIKSIIILPAFSSNTDVEFKLWLVNFKNKSLSKGISQDTINRTFKNVKFLPQVIKYDRKQPEFFEDTITYVSKRATKNRVKTAKKLLKKNYSLFMEVEKKFKVEKEILLALWAIETNFGKHVGKMDIISSLATLSFDTRRSKFFSSQLFTLLKLIDKKLLDPNLLYGSWAGAYGNFQFMPSTINNYAIDYDNNNQIELKKSIKDSVASAANYINKIGWKKGEPCFYKVNLNKKINKKYINLSARKLSNKLKISQWKKKGVIIGNEIQANNNLRAALILPDGKPETPTFLVFNNYEKILKWNRSLRFGVSVCTLAEMIKS